MKDCLLHVYSLPISQGMVVPCDIAIAMGFYILPIHLSTNLTNQVIPQHNDNNSHLGVGHSIKYLLLVMYYPVAVHVGTWWANAISCQFVSQ